MASKGWWTAAVVLILLVAPLVAMLPAAAADDYDPTYSRSFTYDGKPSFLPTLFTGPDLVPLATWKDSQDRLRLSRLEIYKSPKTGLVLSNLPEDHATPVNGMVDRVALDANGILHVIWEDGDGGVWHKGYDAHGNVVINNQRLSATEATASAPSIAATVANEGAMAWIAWIETREHIGTHVRLVSLDPAGKIIDSAFVDDWTGDLGPSACDVAIGLDNRPHVSILAEDGAYWAVPQTDDSFELQWVHDGVNRTLPLLLMVPGDDPWAIWGEIPSLFGRKLVDGTLSPEVENLECGALYSSSPYYFPRATDLATVISGGPLAMSHGDKRILLLYHDGYGGLNRVWPFLGGGEPGVYMPHTMPAATTDHRGQTILAWTTGPRGYSSFYRVLTKGCDVSLSVNQGLTPDEPVPLTPGGSFELPVTVTNLADYHTEVVLEIQQIGGDAGFSGSPSSITAMEVAALNKNRTMVRLSATDLAVLGSTAIFSVKAYHEDWPEAFTSINVHVEVPQYHPFIIRGPVEPVNVIPGEAISIHITLESWSEQDEVVLLAVDAPKGWQVVVPEEVILPAGETKDVEIDVTAPAGEPEGTMERIEFTGETRSGSSGYSGTIITRVSPHIGAQLNIGDGTVGILPGSVASIEATILNTCNLILDLELSATSDREGWSVEVSPGSLSLTPRSEAPVLVTVIAPEEALYQSNCHVTITASVPGFPSLASAMAQVTVTRLVSYELRLFPQSTVLNEGRGTIGVVVSNNGNTYETMSLDFLGLPVGWSAIPAEPMQGQFSIAPFSSLEAFITFTSPPSVPAIDVPVAVVLRGSKEPFTAWAELTVPQTFSATIVLDTTVATVTPPSTVIFPLRVINNANLFGVAYLEARRVPLDWEYSFQKVDGSSAVSFALDAGADESVQLALMVPEDASGDFAIELACLDDRGATLSTRTVYLRLRFPDLTVVDLTTTPHKPRAREPLTVRARVVNLGAADAEDVHVVLKEEGRVLDSDLISLVPRGSHSEVVFYFVPSEGKRTLIVQVDPANRIRERDEANNLLVRRIQVGSAPEEPLVSPTVAVASVAVIITTSIIGLLGGTEFGRYAFFGFLIVLYTKLKKDRVLDHYLRGKIHGYIIANPGEHYNAIKEQLEVTNGALSYHLRVLEREGYVRSRMDGMYKRFYPADMKLPRTSRDISSFQEVILTIVKNNQGVSQKEIAKRIGVSSQVINYHIKILEDSGLIKVDRTRRKSRVYATDAPTGVTE
jgi:predicted transcriptional regulator/uncharacterized membrane protein